MNSMFIPFFGILAALSPNTRAGNSVDSGILRRFDHEMHSEKVFKARSISCAHCHNLELDAAGKKAVAVPDSSRSTFARPPRELCHKCHRGSEVVNKDAPKACYSCHVGIDQLQAIKPRNHENISWRTAHALDAKTDAASCVNCHTTSQCTKCHLSRNDVELKNHSRNFKFFHSVEARGRPHSCDGCHTKSFCVNCHMGKK